MCYHIQIQNPRIPPHMKKGQYNMDTKGLYKIHITDDVIFSNMGGGGGVY